MSRESANRDAFELAAEAMILLARYLEKLNIKQDEIIMDTKKLLDAVTREKTDNASMRALVEANTKAWKDVQAQNQEMVDQIAALQAKLDAVGSADPAAKDAEIAGLKQQVTDLQLAADQAQTDIDSAVSDLSADSDAAEQALAANVPPASEGAPANAPPASQPQDAGNSPASSSSSSSSTGSDGGGVQKPDPLPGTGAAPAASSDQGADASQQVPAANQSGQVDPAATAPNAPPEDASAAGQAPLQADQQKLGSDPQASQAPKSGA